MGIEALTLDELLFLCRQVGLTCLTLAGKDPASMKVGLLLCGDRLLDIERHLRTTKGSLAARSGLHKRTVQRVLQGFEDDIATRSERDRARGEEDHWSLCLEEEREANPTRAGPKTKEKPTPLESASLGRPEGVPEFPAEPRDKNAPTTTQSQQDRNCYRL